MAIKTFDVATVQRFLPTSDGYGVSAIVTDPNDTTRVATESWAWPRPMTATMRQRLP